MLREKGGLMRTAVGRIVGSSRSSIRLGVVASDSDAGEGGAKHLGAGRIDLIKNQAGTGAVREDSKQAGACRGLEDQIRSRNPASERSEVGDRGGGRELLEARFAPRCEQCGSADWRPVR
ncbi:hypothetical protein [Sphingomonas aurantiaca]|uniref:hypothetical protein n=1 Tax=Sphingomonas aurantiaca TaxID=185949 RepID=UPI003A5BCEE3